jgi:pyruvate formate lyase activating enzyme
MGVFLKENSLSSVEIMVYHKFGLSKYDALQMEYQVTASSSPAISKAFKTLEEFGLKVSVHGE